MKYFIIILILIGFVGLTNADEPPQFPGELNPSPYDLWNASQEIIDGTIIQKETKDKITNFDIKVNEVFKGTTKASLVTGFMKNEYSWMLEKGDNALIYLNKEKEISIYSIKVFPNCSAREHIQISPVLPNDNAFVRGAPILPWGWQDPCIPNYFTYDPDFWNYMEYKPPLRQYNDYYLPTHLQRCDGENVPITPKSHPYRIACVKPSTGDTLVNRGWAMVHSCVNTWNVQPGSDSLTCFCHEGEFRKLGGYYSQEGSPLTLGSIQPIFRDGQHGVEVTLNNPSDLSQYAYVYADCEK
ncbi:MAG: hypothetical protein ACRD9Q_02455 [Nitrososphaeraceae archaeon]